MFRFPKPNFIIGSPGNPYLLRWYLIPRNRWLNIYLHKFCRDDDDRALHDHPWWFVSLMIRGRYTEIIAHDHNTGEGRGFIRSAPGLAFRRAEHRHRVVLDWKDGKQIPCWTIVITGPKVRTWGFWCPRGFVPWFNFVDQRDSGNIGKGCGEE